MKSSFLESLSAPFSRRTNKGFTAGKSGGRPPTQANRQRRFRLSLEPLEERLVLSNLLVTSSLDLLNTPGTLRDAVNVANQDGAQGITDSITFAPSLNGAHILLQLGDLELTDGASVDVWGSRIILNGDNDSIFQVDRGASLDLHEVTLASGAAVNGNGGAINNAGTLNLALCTFTSNEATSTATTGPGGLGGAIYNTGTLVSKYPNTFTDNSAWGGGAIANGSGGIASLVDDTYSGNSASSQGGALYNAGALTVYGCTLSGNKAEFGGGLFNDRGTVTLNSATLAGNTATGPLSGSSAGIGGGGAIDNGGALTLTATTVSGNSGYQGGGISCVDLGDGDSLTLVDSIVAGNTWLVASNPPASPTAPFYPDVYNAAVTASTAYNLIGDGTGLSGISNGVKGNQIGTSSAPINPLLAPLGNNGGPTETMPLLSCSPALAAGGPVTTLTAAIGAQDTVIPVADAAVFESTPLTMGFEIDGELMWVQSVDLTNSTVTVSPRSSSPGYTAPASHNAGAGLNYVFNPLGGPPPLTARSLGSAQPGSNQLIVTSASDPASATAGTLRSAVNQANTDAAKGISDTIIFATAQMGTSTIYLQQGNLEFQAGSGTTTIDGGGQVSLSSNIKGDQGFLVDSGAQAVFTGLTIDGGDGINNSGTLTVSNATIADNSGDYGAGINNRGTCYLTDVTVANNQAVVTIRWKNGEGSGGNGGGIYNTGKMTATDCTFFGNSTRILGAGTALPPSGEGGAIWNSGTLSLRATTISGNYGYWSPGGIVNSGKLTMADTIVAGNSEFGDVAGLDDIEGSVDPSSAYNLIGVGFSGLGIKNGASGNRIGTLNAPIKALLGPLGNNGGSTQTMALVPGSPAAGNGEAIAGITTDERGQPLASPPDIGAFQGPKVVSIAVTAPSKAMADTPFSITITAEDASGNKVAGAGIFPITLTSSDPNAVLPTGIILTNGAWTGNVTLHLPGTITLTAGAGSATKKSASVNVSPATPVSLSISSSAAGVTAGKPFSVTVSELDSAGLTALGNTVAFTLGVTGNTQKVSGAKQLNLTTTNGAWTGKITLDTAGLATLFAQAKQGSMTSGSGEFYVGGGAPTHMHVSVPSSPPISAGSPFLVTVDLLDANNNPAFSTYNPTFTCTPTQTVTTAAAYGQPRAYASQ